MYDFSPYPVDLAVQDDIQNHIQDDFQDDPWECIQDDTQYENQEGGSRG